MSKKDRAIEDRLVFLADCGVNGNIPENTEELRGKLEIYMGKDYGPSGTFERERLSVGRLLSWPFNAYVGATTYALGVIGTLINNAAKREVFDVGRLDGFFERDDGTSIFSVKKREDVTYHEPVSEMSDDKLKHFFTKDCAIRELHSGLYSSGLVPSSTVLRSIKGADWKKTQEFLADSFFRNSDHGTRDQYLLEKLGHRQTVGYIDDDQTIAERHEREGLLRLIELRQDFSGYPGFLDALKRFVGDEVSLEGVSPRDAFISCLEESYANEAARKGNRNLRDRIREKEVKEPHLDHEKKEKKTSLGKVLESQGEKVDRKRSTKTKVSSAAKKKDSRLSAKADLVGGMEL